VIGAYPGTFDPPTIAHLAIAEAAVRQCELSRIDLVVNRAPLGKASVRSLDERVAVLESVAATRPWLGVVVTNLRHLADIAEGYDVLILGADKWAQVLDESFYDSGAHRDEAVARLPRLAIARRGELPVPGDCVVLDVEMHDVSSTAARAGRADFALPEARDH
jgi:cytidyltransferase-like protein